MAFRGTGFFGKARAMDYGELGAFATVYECGSINKGAKRLYISPQGLSKALARLEAELGCPLFERTHQGLVPTRDARALYVRVRDLLDTCEQIRNRTVREGVRSALTVPSASGTLSFTGLGFVAEFECENPLIELHMEDMTNRLVDQALSDRTAEAGLLVGPIDSRRYEGVLFSSHPHLLVVDCDDPLASKEQVAYADLEDRTVILLGRDHPLYATFSDRLARAHVVPRDLIGVAVINDMLPMVSRDQAVLVSAEFWAQAAVGEHHVIVPFEDKTLSWDIYLVHRRGEVLSPVAQTFWEYALRWAREKGYAQHG